MENLTKWFIGVGFTGTEEQECRDKFCDHFREFVEDVLVFDSAVEKVSDLESFHKCAICAKKDQDFKWTVGNPESANDIVKLKDCKCTFLDWGKAEHMVHSECLKAGVFDTLRFSSGVTMGNGMYRLNPVCISREKIAEHCEILTEGSVTKLVPSFGPLCPFCTSLGIAPDSTTVEAQYHASGFRDQPNAARDAIYLATPGSLSPFPVGGTIILRPCFDAGDKAAVMQLAVQGTIIDFNGYRAMDLHVVCLDANSGEKSLLRLFADSAGYAIVPFPSVRDKGLAFFMAHPNESMARTLYWNCLEPDPESKTALTEDGIYAYHRMLEDQVDDSPGTQTFLLRPLTESIETDVPLISALESVESILTHLEQTHNITVDNDKEEERPFFFAQNDPKMVLPMVRKKLEEIKKSYFAETGFPPVARYRHGTPLDVLTGLREFLSSAEEKEQLPDLAGAFEIAMTGRAKEFEHLFLQGHLQSIRVAGIDESDMPEGFTYNTRFSKQVPKDCIAESLVLSQQVVDEYGIGALVSLASWLDLSHPLAFKVEGCQVVCSAHAVWTKDWACFEHGCQPSEEDEQVLQNILDACRGIVQDALARFTEQSDAQAESETVELSLDDLGPHIYQVLVDENGKLPPKTRFEPPFCSTCSARLPKTRCQCLVESVMSMPTFYDGRKNFWGPSVKIEEGKEYKYR